MLLFGSSSLGWRPVELLRPLRDLRKVAPKFSLSADEARKLLGAAAVTRRQNIDNSIKPLKAGASGGRHGARVAPNTDSDDDDDVAVEPDDDDDDDDGNDDDVDDEDASSDADGALDTTNEAGVTDSAKDDDGDIKDALTDRAGAARLDQDDDGVRLAPSVNQRALDQVSQVSPGQLQVSGRSAAAALVEASIQGSLTSQSPIELTPLDSKTGVEDESARLQVSASVH